MTGRRKFSLRRSERQLQIGDKVKYLPEGVITVVKGYVWVEGIGTPPAIVAYELTCGIAVPRKYLKWLGSDHSTFASRAGKF